MEYVDTNKSKRILCIEQNNDWLKNAVMREGKGRNIRRNFVCYLRCMAAKTFISDDEEYERIGKFGRGAWNERTFEAFTQEEFLKIKTIGEAYGAFSY
jgi:hypothetical protein